ncbi:unnamed protein product, partial [Ixodes hexagonus]
EPTASPRRPVYLWPKGRLRVLDTASDAGSLYVPTRLRARRLPRTGSSPYGKLVKIERTKHIDRPTVCTGIRIAWMEMRPDKPVANFIRILEHHVTCDYLA